MARRPVRTPARPTQIDVRCLAYPEGFEEEGYLEANLDVAAAVARGTLANGRDHFETFGRHEKRPMVQLGLLREMRRQKLERIAPILDMARPHTERDGRHDFLPPEMEAGSRRSIDDPASSNVYGNEVLELIEICKGGIILDCGAGDRVTYYSNVVNLEIVDFPSTDILASGNVLPFKDNSFDGVISMAVLEHVRDPFRCAAEIARVLKPGGRLVCCVPFLQPEHGYPHHYYNMAPQGLHALFEGLLTIDKQLVLESTLPIWSLTWFIRAWSDGLNEAAKHEFLNMRLGDLLVSPSSLIDRSWVKQLPEKKNFELASATTLWAHK